MLFSFSMGKEPLLAQMSAVLQKLFESTKGRQPLFLRRQSETAKQ
jgi:hypothetical protein